MGLDEPRQRTEKRESTLEKLRNMSVLLGGSKNRI